jgi:hypothetical protein
MPNTNDVVNIEHFYKYKFLILATFFQLLRMLYKEKYK